MFPLEVALDLDIKDMQASIAELKGKRAADFIDTAALREVEREGFFAWTQ
jgi:hypothetical protein